MRFLIRSAALAALVSALAACGVTPQPSHGAESTPSGVQVYGTIDVGAGKVNSR